MVASRKSRKVSKRSTKRSKRASKRATKRKSRKLSAFACYLKTHAGQHKTIKQYAAAYRKLRPATKAKCRRFSRRSRK